MPVSATTSASSLVTKSPLGARKLSLKPSGNFLPLLGTFTFSLKMRPTQRQRHV